MHLVLGSPGIVARRVVELLLEREEQVLIIVSEAESCAQPEGVQCFVGDFRRIDFGVSGSDYRHLLAAAKSVVVAVDVAAMTSTVENSDIVRAASETREFIKAGGAPCGVHFLSSLLVFGNATGLVHEGDFDVGQGFSDRYERSVALAEKIIREVGVLRSLAILRTGPIVGDEEEGCLVKDTPLSILAASLGASSREPEQVFSDTATRYETAERAASALMRLAVARPAQVAHLVDREPLTDRELTVVVADRLGKMVREHRGGGAAWIKWTRAAYSGSRAVRGWSLEFDREAAEAEFSDLLDRDEIGTLDRLLRNLEPKGE